MEKERKGQREAVIHQISKRPHSLPVFQEPLPDAVRGSGCVAAARTSDTAHRSRKCQGEHFPIRVVGFILHRILRDHIILCLWSQTVLCLYPPLVTNCDKRLFLVFTYNVPVPFRGCVCTSRGEPEPDVAICFLCFSRSCSKSIDTFW